MSRRLLTSCLVAAVLVLVHGVPALAAAFPGETIDGPSADVQRLGGLALARDGSGGVVYIKRDAGLDHVFVSRLVLGALSAPERVDAGLSGIASSAVIAAGDNGRLAVAFLSGTALYTTVLGHQGARFSAPQLVADSATSPALGMSIHGAGYLAFDVPGLPARVRVAHLGLKATSFDLAPDVLNVDASRNAGDSEAKRPRVNVSADGTALVAWGEDGSDARTHVIARRVVGTSLSVAPQDVTMESLDGHGGGSADSPQVRLQDNGSLGWIVFRQSFNDSGTQRTRTLARRLVGSLYDPPFKVDGLAFPAPEGSDPPSFDLTGYGDGVVAVGLASSHQTIVGSLLSMSFETPGRADSQPNTIAPDPVVAIGENDRGLVAWQQSTGPADPATMRARELDQGALGTETPLSTAGRGAVDATLGVEAHADQQGDVAVAFVQGGITDRRIVVAEDTQPPRRFQTLFTRAFKRQRRPTLAWQPAKAFFSAVTYRVLIDGHALGATTSTRWMSPRAIPDGVHRLVVRAVDRHGQSTPSRPASLRIDSTPPRVRVAVHGASVTVTVVDVVAARASGRRQSSGMGSVHISWGDGNSSSGAATHHYGHGSHTLRVVAVDRAGNVARIHRAVHT
ncbi:MAG TPA: hypothetical protein VGN69_02680 [Solirubrobacteraceae bacterium]|jgi:hypothetical protein|nr:hypothetical protein [Solirubrobacteraceae bacterium]